MPSTETVQITISNIPKEALAEMWAMSIGYHLEMTSEISERSDKIVIDFDKLIDINSEMCMSMFALLMACHCMSTGIKPIKGD